MSAVYIYALCDPDDGGIRYVGKSHNPQARLAQHLAPSSLKRKSHKNNWLRSLLSRAQKPALVILESTDRDNCDVAEIRQIAEHLAQGHPLTNLTAGGDGAFGYRHTSEGIAKMSHAAQNRTPAVMARILEARNLAFQTEEHSLRMSVHFRDLWKQPWYQALRSRSAREHMTDEHKAKLMNGLANMPKEEKVSVEARRIATCQSEEFRCKMSEIVGQRGDDWKQKISESCKNMSPEARARITEGHQDRSREWRNKIGAAQRGRKQSDETKQKRAEAMRLKWQEPEYRDKMLDIRAKQGKMA